MAQTALLFPATASQIASGFYQWNTLDNIKADDGAFATGAYVGATTHSWRKIQLLIANATAGTDKGTPTTGVDYTTPDTFGNASDLWGNTLTPAIVNSPDFGVAVEVGRADTGASVSYIIYATGFNPNLPSSAVITGIEVLIDYGGFAGGGGTTGMQIDYIAMRIHYTWNPVVLGGGTSSGAIYIENPEPVETKKLFRHRVYEPGGNFIGEWNDTQEEPTFTREINNPLSSMDVKFARNDLTRINTVDELTTEDDELLVTEDDQTLLIDLAAGVGLGEGTDLDLNLDYKLTAYYGTFEPLATENDEPIVTEDDELIAVQEGYPEGRDIFTGFVARWDADWGESEDLAAYILSHSDELNNIMLETADTVELSNNSLDSGSTYLGTYGGSKTTYGSTYIRQSMTPASTYKLARLRLRAIASSGIDAVLRARLYSGTYPSGTLIDTGEVTILAATGGYANYDIGFSTTPILTNGQPYYFLLDSLTSGTYDSPIYLKTGPAYAAGDAYSGQIQGNGSVLDTAITDLYFSTYKAGGQTTVPFLSQPVESILKQVIDFARSRGARINYTPESIEPTGQIVSYTFNTNTIREALDKILELAPADWWYRYDFGTNTFYLQPRPTTEQRVFTLGKDIIRFKLSRSMENLVNDVYLSGGGTPALFKRVTDITSISDWRRGLKKISDNRVTVDATAIELAQHAIDREGNPIYSAQGRIGNTDYAIEDVMIGELGGFGGFGTFVDELGLQLVRIKYTPPDYLDIEFEALLPKVAKRIEDIRRNLDELEQSRNPAAPS